MSAEGSQWRSSFDTKDFTAASATAAVQTLADVATKLSRTASDRPEGQGSSQQLKPERQRQSGIMFAAGILSTGVNFAIGLWPPCFNVIGYL